MLATWSLSVEHAHELPPAGLSWPALVFAAALDTSGIPAAVLTSPAACAYITGRTGITSALASPSALATARRAPTADLVRSAYAALERLGLVSVDPASAVRTVWLHTAVRAAVRAYLAPGNVEQAAAAAATALLEAWPEAGAPGSGPHLSQALRDSAAALRAFAGDLLWKPEAHPVLLRAGTSLTEAPALTDSAIGYWQALSAASSQLLGYGHAQSVLARDRLADAYAGSGRFAEALPVFEATLSDREATFGPQHAGDGHRAAERGRVTERGGAGAGGDRAVRAGARGAGADERARAPGDARGAGAARRRLRGGGRRGDSIRLYERSLADAERELGPAHRDTLSARVSLGGAYLAAARARRSPRSSGRSPTRSARRARTTRPPWPRGPAWPRLPGRGEDQGGDRRTSGCSPTGSGCSGRTIPTRSPRAEPRLRLPQRGRLKEAIPQYERVVATGSGCCPGHRDTLAARAILASAYQQGRRPREAIAAYERVVADSERALGPGDIDTLTTVQPGHRLLRGGPDDRRGQGAAPGARRLRAVPGRRPPDDEHGQGQPSSGDGVTYGPR